MAKKHFLQIRIPEEMYPIVKEFQKKAKSKGENSSIMIRRFIRAYVKGDFDSSSFFWKTNNDDVSLSQI